LILRTANLDRPSISVIGCRRPFARTAAHCALRPKVCWRLRRKAHRLDVRQGQKFKPHHHATAWHTPSGRISVRAARDGRERAPACREARSIARKHPFRKVRSCERGLSGVTSGASADDTSDLPWRGARLRRSRLAARAQWTMRRSTAPTAAQSGWSARGAKRRAPLARPILGTAGACRRDGRTLGRPRHGGPQQRAKPDNPLRIQGEAVIWSAAVNGKMHRRSDLRRATPRCLRKMPCVVKRDVSK
jgi:hypothetical protein